MLTIFQQNFQSIVGGKTINLFEVKKEVVVIKLGFLAIAFLRQALWGNLEVENMANQSFMLKLNVLIND